MINFNTIKDTIYDWVNTRSGLATIWQFQNFSVPDKSFFSLRLSTFTQIHDEQVVDAENPIAIGDKDYFITYDFILEILGFGPGSVQATLDLKSSLAVPEIRNDLKLNGGIIAFNDTNAVQDISGIDGHLNEERSSWDVQMRTSDHLTNINWGQIDIVNGDGVLKQPNKPNIDSPINVDSTI